MKFIESPQIFEEIMSQKSMNVCSKRNKRIENEKTLLVSSKYLLTMSILRKLLRRNQVDTKDETKSMERQSQEL